MRVHATQIGPQRGMRCKHPPPCPTYVGQRDHAPLSVVCIPKVREESEDFWRDSVDWCGSVPPGLYQLENLENTFLKDIKLEPNTHQSQSTRPFRSLV